MCGVCHRWEVSDTPPRPSEPFGKCSETFAQAWQCPENLQRCSKNVRRKKSGKPDTELLENIAPHFIIFSNRSALKLAPYLARKCINSVGLSTIKSKAFLLVTQINSSGNSKKSVSRRKCGMYYQPWIILF